MDQLDFSPENQHHLQRIQFSVPTKRIYSASLRVTIGQCTVLPYLQHLLDGMVYVHRPHANPILLRSNRKQTRSPKIALISLPFTLGNMSAAMTSKRLGGNNRKQDEMIAKQAKLTYNFSHYSSGVQPIATKWAMMLRSQPNKMLCKYLMNIFMLSY